LTAYITTKLRRAEAQQRTSSFSTPLYLASDAPHRWELCQVRRFQIVALDARIVYGDVPYKYCQLKTQFKYEFLNKPINFRFRLCTSIS
jgi:hypothetical protein